MKIQFYKINFVLSAGAVEYTNGTSAKGYAPHQKKKTIVLGMTQVIVTFQLRSFEGCGVPLH